MRCSVRSLFLATILPVSWASWDVFINPYYDPSLDVISDPLTTAPPHRNNNLFRRQATSGCPASYSPCSTLNAGNACCTAGTNCALDQAGQVACCSSGAVCTGVISNSGTAPPLTSSTRSSAGAGVGGGAVAGGGMSATSTTTLFSTLTSGASSTTGRTVVSNAYYTFPALAAATFPNAQSCSQAASSCQSQYSACVTQLAGSGNNGGVTVSAPNGGATLNANTGSAAAVSICSTLSLQACQGLQSQYCNAFGTGNAGSTATPSASAGGGGAQTATASAAGFTSLGAAAVTGADQWTRTWITPLTILTEIILRYL